MEFWGEEVKPGMTVPCQAGDGYVIHLSQAALGETKKGIENVIVSVKVEDKKLVIGTLSTEKHPQIMCDLIFDQDFELSHNSKNASVFLCGYKSVVPDMFETDSGEEDDELETDNLPMKNNEIEKSAAKVPAKDDKKSKQDDDETSSGDDDISSEDDMSEDESSSDDETSSGADPSSDSEYESDDSEDQETPTPKKPEVSKKRAAENSMKTPSDKKAKTATPSGQKSGDKKGVHVATPHPAKQVSKTPADKSVKTPAGDKKTKEKLPKEEKSPNPGSHACKSCSKIFGTESALQSHQKAKKHEA